MSTKRIRLIINNDKQSQQFITAIPNDCKTVRELLQYIQKQFYIETQHSNNVNSYLQLEFLENNNASQWYNLPDTADITTIRDNERVR